MKKKLQTGAYVKATGADWGFYFDGKKWIQFECVGCVFALGLADPKLKENFGDHTRLNWKKHNFVIRHDTNIHNNWLQTGKPYKKEN